MTRKQGEFDAGRSAGAHLADKYSQMALDARAESGELRQRIAALEADLAAARESRKRLVALIRVLPDKSYFLGVNAALDVYQVRALKAEADLAAVRAENQALRNAMNDMLASAMASADVICEWKETQDGESWETSCGDEFIIIDGSPSENGLKFCPYCGKHLVVKAPEPESKED